MNQLGNRTGLLHKTLHEHGIARMIGRQHLNSDIAIKVGLIGLEDGCHAANTDTLDDAKLTQRSTDQSIQIVVAPRLTRV